jgi:error-prone DNA polymerase
MLNSQPMGFYQPAQLVRDAREHGVEVRAADVMASDWDCTLENSDESPSPLSSPRIGGKWREAPKGGVDDERGLCGETPLPRLRRYFPPEAVGRDSGFALSAVRLGLRQISGLKEAEAGRLIEARDAGAGSLREIAARAALSRRSLELLAEADALRALGLDRRQGLWAVKGLAPETKARIQAPLLALMGPPAEAPAALPAMALGAHVAEDYRTAGLSLKAHPCVFFRTLLTDMGAVSAARLKAMRDGARVSVGGLVLIRQRPGTAKGVVFATLEDETGIANAVVWPDVFAVNRRTVMSASFLVVSGRLQRASDVIHVVAERFVDLSGRLAELKNAGVEAPRRRPSELKLQASRDFH